MKNSNSVTAAIASLSNQDLMKLFLKYRPWNTSVEFINSKFVVLAEPLVSDERQVELIKRIFSRLQVESELFAAQLKVEHLNSISEVIGVPLKKLIDFDEK